MTMPTWTAYYTDGTMQDFYCAKDEILDYMSVSAFMKLDRVEMVNRPGDPVKHRPISKDVLLLGTNF